MTLSVVRGSREEYALVQQVILWSLHPPRRAALPCCQARSRPLLLCPAPRMLLALGLPHMGPALGEVSNLPGKVPPQPCPPAPRPGPSSGTHGLGNRSCSGRVWRPLVTFYGGENSRTGTCAWGPGRPVEKGEAHGERCPSGLPENVSSKGRGVCWEGDLERPSGQGHGSRPHCTLLPRVV